MLVVLDKAFPQSALCIIDTVVSMQIDLFVFHTPPQPFHEHVVPPAAFAVHADLDAAVLQQLGKFEAGELV